MVKDNSTIEEADKSEIVAIDDVENEQHPNSTPRHHHGNGQHGHHDHGNESVCSASDASIKSKFNNSSRKRKHDDGKINKPQAAPIPIPPIDGEKISSILPNNAAIKGEEKVDVNDEDEAIQKKKKKYIRCSMCRKKVGLIEFTCRCGGVYCALHRYSDKHDCSFDYRELGAQEIRRNNPVVIGEKIRKLL